MNNLMTRALTGAGYVLVVVLGVTLPYWWAPLILACLLAWPALVEFHKMFLTPAPADGTTLPVPTARLDAVAWCDVVSGFLFVVFMGSLMWVNSFVFEASSLLSILIILYFVLRIFVAVLDKGPNPLRGYARYMASWPYILMAMASLLVLCYDKKLPYVALMMFVMIWCNDTGAYLVGSTMGKNKMCPRLSPKKSWEGFFGGLILSIIAGAVWSWCCPSVPLSISLTMGAVVSIAATFGDLFESMIKRRCGVKDSGTLLPGHGGMLDRIDSLLCCAPLVLILLSII